MGVITMEVLMYIAIIFGSTFAYYLAKNLAIGLSKIVYELLSKHLGLK